MDPVAELEYQISQLRRQQDTSRTRERFWELHDEIVVLDRQARAIAARQREGFTS
jgi:hypothetical protein